MSEVIGRADFEDFVGKRGMKLCGVDFLEVESINDWRSVEVAQTVRFKINDTYLVATEDPEDGYRSSLDHIEVYNHLDIKNTFPPVEVICELDKGYDGRSNNVLVFKSVANGLTIMEIGTKNTDDYYPYFVAEFLPQNMPINPKSMPNNEKVKKEPDVKKAPMQRVAEFGTW